jgi:hypothetical protein
LTGSSAFADLSGTAKGEWGSHMTSGEFVIGLMTIITGLAIADMIVSLHGLLLNRHRITWDWLSLLVALLVFLTIVATLGRLFSRLCQRAAKSAAVAVQRHPGAGDCDLSGGSGVTARRSAVRRLPAGGPL